MNDVYRMLKDFWDREWNRPLPWPPPWQLNVSNLVREMYEKEVHKRRARLRRNVQWVARRAMAYVDNRA